MASSSEGSQEGSDDNFSLLDDSSTEKADFHDENGQFDLDACKEFIKGQNVQGLAFRNLIVFSVLMFTFPFGAMYGVFYLLKNYLGWTTASAVVPAALVAAFVVYLIIAIFIYVAYQEVKGDSELNDSSKKKD